MNGNAEGAHVRPPRGFREAAYRTITMQDPAVEALVITIVPLRTTRWSPVRSRWHCAGGQKTVRGPRCTVCDVRYHYARRRAGRVARGKRSSGGGQAAAARGYHALHARRGTYVRWRASSKTKTDSPATHSTSTSLWTSHRLRKSLKLKTRTTFVSGSEHGWTAF